MDKVASMLDSLGGEYRVHAQASEGLPDHLKDRFPKLSRGENYLGLPYMILDYPAAFDKNSVFAIRTLFWWGHYFSLTLHLKGEYLDKYLPGVIRGLNGHSPATWHVSISDQEWVHEVQEEDYADAKTLSLEKWAGMAKHPFIKVVSLIPLEQWDLSDGLLEALFMEILGWLNC